jgi:single-strand selective monofunctional uracil DNA glycosylase
MDMISISKKLSRDVSKIPFGAQVAFVYNPLDYAWKTHEIYLERYGNRPRDVVLVGMNPGPFGMVQTGVPFGDVTVVREWLKIEGAVGRPSPEHPKRPVQGFSCPRGEVSGQRLWGWARDRFKTPERFFSRFFVLNYCPLAFMEETGRNLTPDKLPSQARDKLFEVCDRALGDAVSFFDPEFAIGIGAFAEKRLKTALAGVETSATIGRILHPSPASPAANRGWAEQVEQQLAALGLL